MGFHAGELLVFHGASPGTALRGCFKVVVDAILGNAAAEKDFLLARANTLEATDLGFANLARPKRERRKPRLLCSAFPGLRAWRSPCCFPPVTVCLFRRKDAL